MAYHQENFVAIRTMHPRTVWRPHGRFAVTNPETADELDYRDLLSAANDAYFHREYSLALKLYLELRQKILVQSHPELPATPGIIDGVVLDASVIELPRLVELSRRILSDSDPGAPVSIPADDRRLFTADEVEASPVLATFSELTVDPGVVAQATGKDLRAKARTLVRGGDIDAAAKAYAEQAKQAADAGRIRLAADTLAESGAMLATYADRTPDTRDQAAKKFRQAATYYLTLGDTQGQESMTANLAALDKTSNGTALHATRADLPTPVTDQVYLVPDRGALKASAAIISGTVATQVQDVGIQTSAGPVVMSLDKEDWATTVTTSVLGQRVNATTLAELAGWDTIGTTFVAYIPHLFFSVLPLAIADTYRELGRYSQAVATYTGVLNYPYLNIAIEGADLWIRLASTQLRWGDDLFRRGQDDAAATHYRQIVETPYAVPDGSPLYQPGQFSAVRDQVEQVVEQLKGTVDDGQPNPRIAEIVTAAARQLLKIDAGLNILGLSADYAPVLRFSYLQSAANYLADNAIQAERTFIQFRSQAEQQKFERIQLENAVALNQAALQVEQKRQADAALEMQAASDTLNLTQVRQANAQANLDDWDTLGRELTSVNAALAWAANSANDNDITYTGVQYHGESHDYSGEVEDFFDTVGEVREWLNFDIQRNRIARQVAESAAEVQVAQTRLAQATVRAQVQALNTELARVRLEGSREVLDYAEDRMFDEDLWFALAGNLRDLARGYLDMAIEAAYIMERAYELEFDRDLHRIRTDYGVTGPEGLLGGDHLKQDIASFTLDYIRHAEKQNPVRVPLSLREEFPQAFAEFQRTGVLPFRTDLEIFDRRHPGSSHRKIKRIEVFVEGLIPVDGISGELRHAGISTEWRAAEPGGFAKHNRVVPAETMLLSSYQFRRDYAVLTPKDEVLALFENLGPQANWTLSVWPSANDLDFASVSDVTVVFYLDGGYDAALAAHTRTLYGTSGGRAFVRSARLHEPDEYFRIERDRQVAFHVGASQFPHWAVDPTLTAFAVRLVGSVDGPSLANRQLSITRASDGATATGTTGPDGTLAGDATTMAPFDDWHGDDAADSYTVAFADGDDLAPIVDVQLAVSYAFTYRADQVA